MQAAGPTNGRLAGEDNFFRAEIERDAGVGAENYSFFDFSGGAGPADALGGSLEDGLEAPPEEEVLLEEGDLDLPLEQEEDFSLTSVLVNELQLGEGPGASRLEAARTKAVADRALKMDNQPYSFGLGGPPKPAAAPGPSSRVPPPSSSAGSAPSGPQLGTPPAASAGFSPLSGLPGVQPSSMLFPQPPPVLLSPQQLQQQQQQYQLQQQRLQQGPPPAAPQPPKQPRAMMAAELEAQLLGTAVQSPAPGQLPMPSFSQPMQLPPAGQAPLRPGPPQGMAYPGMQQPGMMGPPPPPPPGMAPRSYASAALGGDAKQASAAATGMPQPPAGGPPPPSFLQQLQGAGGPPPPPPPPPGGGHMPPPLPGAPPIHMQMGPMRPPPPHLFPFPPPLDAQGRPLPLHLGPGGKYIPMPPPQMPNMPPMAHGMPPGMPHMRPGGPGGPNGPMMMVPGMGGPAMGPGPPGPPGVDATLRQLELQALQQFHRQSQQQGPGQQQQQRQQYPHQQPRPQRRPGGRYMTSDDVDYIMRAMYAAVNSGVSYIEDYYFQLIQEYLERNKANLTGQTFVSVEGLGKIAYTNIRTPKPLMDLSAASPAAAQGAGGRDGQEGGGGAAPAAAVKSLEQEPLLAARIMIEDCMGLLLDVDDINRILTAPEAFQHVDAAQLQHSKAVMVDAIIASFRLPDAPVPASVGDGRLPSAAAIGDGVFLRLMALPKGRSLMAATLNAVYYQRTWDPARYGLDPKLAIAPLQVVWAVMRNAPSLFEVSSLFSDRTPDARLVHATSKLARMVASVVSTHLHRSEDVNAALLAFVSAVEAAWSGTGARAGQGVIEAGPGREMRVLPLSLGEAAMAGQPWLGSILEALLGRASEVVGGGSAFTEWRQLYHRFSGLMMVHLNSLKVIHGAAASSGDTQVLAAVQRAMRPGLLGAMMAHASDADRAALQSFVALAQAPQQGGGASGQ